MGSLLHSVQVIGHGAGQNEMGSCQTSLTQSVLLARSGGGQVRLLPQHHP